MDVLTIVVPCYNEEEVLPETKVRLLALLDDMIKAEKISEDSRILFVNDGSKDITWSLIEEYHKENKKITGIKLAKNAGHQNALFAGLMKAKEDSDILVSVDADLQDDINVIKEMVDKYHEGNDIVYGVRKERKTDTFFKRTTALAFYKVMDFMGANTIYNHADFRLMSKRAVEHLAEFDERNLFLRGMVPLIGYQTAEVYYDRTERFAGESKYPLKKMIALAIDGITSFSVKPMTMISGVGITFVFISILASIYSLISFFTGNVVPGWTSLILSVWFLGGMILLSIGIVGQYIGKIYIEVKHRPRYNIEKYLR